MNRGQVSRRNKWTVDFTTPPRSANLPSRRPTPNPVGYSEQKMNANAADQTSDSKLISKRSWNIALGPVKQIPMNLFIMYMSGNSISIFPIMIVGMMFFRSTKAIMAYKATFKMLNEDAGQALFQKLAWIMGNLLGIVVATWKCQSMGLLPTSPSDWLAFKEHRQRVEYVMGGMNS